jgi:hypothetical protein
MVLPDPRKSRVVLIGASRFADPGLDDLPAVRNNLDGLARCFRDREVWGLPRAHCVVVDDPDSHGDVLDPVHDAAGEAEDTLVVYYAGHGLVHPRTNELLLALVGTLRERTHTAVPYAWIRDSVIEAAAPRRVVILDCCYSGRAIGGMADPTTAVVDEASAEGTYVLAAAPPNKQALSPPGERYTAFTGALLALFDDGLPGGPQLFQLDDIYRHVRDALRRRSRPEPQRRAGNTAGDLALARNRRWTSTAARPAPTEPARTEDRKQRKQARSDPVRKPIREPVRTAAPDIHKATRAAASAGLPPASVVIDLLRARYQLLEVIGGGSSKSEVWTATDHELNQPVAVKVVPPSAELKRAALAAAAMNHHGIVTILDAQSNDDVLCIVMEYVEGRTIEAMLRTGNRIEPVRAAWIMSKVCDALTYGHVRGVAHGDLHTGRVMITSTDTVKLVGFGLGPGTSESDIASAGWLLLQLLTGVPPVDTSRLPPRHVTGIPAELHGIVERAVYRDRQTRYRTAAEMYGDLERFRAG